MLVRVNYKGISNSTTSHPLIYFERGPSHVKEFVRIPLEI